MLLNNTSQRDKLGSLWTNMLSHPQIPCYFPAVFIYFPDAINVSHPHGFAPAGASSPPLYLGWMFCVKYTTRAFHDAAENVNTLLLDVIISQSQDVSICI